MKTFNFRIACKTWDDKQVDDPGLFIFQHILMNGFDKTQNDFGISSEIRLHSALRLIEILQDNDAPFLARTFNKMSNSASTLYYIEIEYDDDAVTSQFALSL